MRVLSFTVAVVAVLLALDAYAFDGAVRNEIGYASISFGRYLRHTIEGAMAVFGL